MVARETLESLDEGVYRNPTRALINISVFQENVAFVRRLAPEARIMLPVKANAYGHGDLLISQAAAEAGVDFLAVARVNEGLKLRSGGIELPIVLLGVESGTNIGLALRNDLELSVSSPENLAEIIGAAEVSGRRGRIHLKVDTGMTRLGCREISAAMMAERICRSEHLDFASFYTHFAMSGTSEAVTGDQVDGFLRARDDLEKNGTVPEFYHLSNSGGILSEIERLRVEIPPRQYALRPGIMCYGYAPNGEPHPELRPVMTLVSKVIHTFEVPAGTSVGYGHTYTTQAPTRLATVPVGYGDGLFRILSGKLAVRINGRDYPQRGRIGMDLIVVEVDESVVGGDDAHIFGDRSLCAQDADYLAKVAGTISYEITSSVVERVERVPVRNR